MLILITLGELFFILILNLFQRVLLMAKNKAGPEESKTPTSGDHHDSISAISNNEANKDTQQISKSKVAPEQAPQPPQKPPSKRASYSELFKYSTPHEKLQVSLGILFSLMNGLIQPTYGIVIKQIVEIFDPNVDPEEKGNMMNEFMIPIIVLSIGNFLTSWAGFTLMQIAAERLSFKLRAKYLASLMKQEIAYFEKQQIEALPSKMAEFFTHISEGSGEKMGQLVTTVGATVSGITIALIISPYYGLCLLAYLPFGTKIMFAIIDKMKATVMEKFKMNAMLGAFTEEMLSSLKLIISFGKEKLKLEEYRKLADMAYQSAKKSQIVAGMTGGSFMIIMVGFSCFSWAVGFAMLKYEVPNPRADRPVTVGDIVGSYQAMMYGMFTIMQIQTLYGSVTRALMTGKEVIDVIDREPLIATPADTSVRVTNPNLNDGIKFQNVAFRYPTAPEHVRDVFEDATFKVKSGTSTAIVGPSGSGKSTIVQMINRFYDPTGGEIIFGTDPLKNVDLTCLREMIGWVGQEPVLIIGTVRENLKYGNSDATDQDIERAINLANAQFVYEMEKGLDSYVGSSTVLNLSGGQKQRIAIARALIKRPKILVLDEATSALDPKSEAEVQNAILNVQKQQAGDLTIIMIAHRLQTIKTADNLLYLENPNSVLSASKGTDEYQQLLDRLMKTNYAHQADAAAVEEDNISVESVDSDSEEEKKDKNQSAEQDDAENKRRLSKHVNKMLKRDSHMSTAAKAAQKAIDDKKGKVQVRTNFESPNSGWSRLFTYYKPAWVLFLLIILACFASLAMPVIAFCIIKLQFTYYSKDVNPDWEIESRNYLIGMASWLFCLFFIISIEKGIFGAMGEKMTLALRMELIDEILHKQVSWFDRDDRAPGIITNTVSADISSLNGMTSEVIVTIFELVAIFCVGLGGGLYFCWQAAILSVLLSPIMVVGMYMMLTMQFGHKGGRSKDLTVQSDELDNYSKSKALLSDVVINYRTVISLGQKNVDKINDKFEELLEGPLDIVKKQATKMGAYYGLGTAGRMLYIAIMFLVAIQVLIVEWGIDGKAVFTACYFLFFSFMSLGAQASNVPSIKRAKEAAKPIFSIIDEVSTLDVRKSAPKSIKVVQKGKIEFKDVFFNYPTRSLKVMDKFNVHIPAGSKIALVGHSGCGKSTLINILLRFYNINEGQVLIDDDDLNNYDVLSLREQCGYVMQEPVLFNTDIKKNIRFGKPDATDEEIYIAAKKANALNFIEDNIDNLKPDERREKINQQFQEAFAAKQVSYPSLCALQDDYSQQNDLSKQILIDLLTSCSDDLLKKANSKVSVIREAINFYIQRYGASWEDIVMRFEWRDELTKIHENQELPISMKQSIDQMLQNKAELYGYFNMDTIQRAVKNGSTDVESLTAFVTEEMRQYRMTIAEKRFHELQLMDIDRKRDEKGEFKLHEGFSKDCGPKGGKLSGGQKQRVAIARALIKDPKILILDEATSALDESSQEIVQQALDRAMEGRTSIVIAHRLSTIRNCDILFVIGNGKVLESDSYEKLSADQNSHFNILKAGMEN